MQTKFSNTIITNETQFSETNAISLTNKQFFDLLISEGSKTVFRPSERKFRTFIFFIVKAGYVFYTDCYFFMNYEKFFKCYMEAEEKGFKHLIDYLKAKGLGLENEKDYSEFKKSSFHNSEYDYSNYNDYDYEEKILKYIESNTKRFKAYLDSIKRGFERMEDYVLANILGINKYEEFYEFQSSPFYNDAMAIYVLEGNQRANNTFKENYNQYKSIKIAEKEAAELGFNNINDYNQSISLNIKDSKLYYEFLESGCSTKEEFEFLKKLPLLIEEKKKKIQLIIKDADKAYNSERYEEFVRLRFLLIEKTSEVIYHKIFRKDLEYNEETKVDDVIYQIESALNQKLVDHEELKYWRRIRNNIVHDHAKIEKDKAEKSKEFFEEIFKKLNKIISE